MSSSGVQTFISTDSAAEKSSKYQLSSPFADVISPIVGVIVVMMFLAFSIAIVKGPKSPFYAGMQSSYDMYNSKPHSVY